MTKRLIMITIFGAGLALGLVAPPAETAAQEMATHRDARHAFALSFPKDWRVVQFKDGPDFHVVGNDGKGPEDCNVIVQRVSGPAYLDRANQNAMLADIRQAVRDAEFKEWRRQTIERRWGVYYVVSGTVPGMKQPYKQTTLGFQVVVGSKLYTLSCSAPATSFDQQRALFERIAASLSF